jgi:hypothetical protein
LNSGDNNVQIFKNLGGGVANRPPAAPSLISPSNRAFINSASPPLRLVWKVPNDLDGDSLHFRIEFDVDENFSSPFLIVQSSESTAGFVPTPPVAQSTDSVYFELSTPLQDGLYWWRVSAWDGSVFGAASTPRSFIVDKTPPTGTLASSPAVSAEESFLVSWGGTGTDGNGSGLSGIYDVRVQINNGPWTNWLTIFPGTSAVYTGVQGQTYGFEAAAYDSAGNLEAFLEIAETTTLVDTTANDVSAPGPPLSLTANGSNPSPWQNDPVFQISWQAPPDPSGIARALFKRGDPPTANFDTTGSTTTSSTDITATQEDGQNFYLWFQDGRGNVNFQNNDFVQLLYDNTLPEIVESNILNPDFKPNWFNQGVTTSAAVGIIYTERHLQQIRLVSVGLGTNIIMEGVQSGEAVSVPFDINIEGKSDGVYEIEFTLVDSAGNSGQDVNTIALDNTPPSGAEASSPQKSSTESFVVSWEGTATDGDGSGISGIYDVKVQTDGGAWENWLTNFQGTSSEFQGAQGRTYAFEAVAYDNVGNVESFLEIPETVTVVDTGFVDVVPPSIVHTPVSFVDEGQNLDIEAQVLDDNQVAEVSLFYKQGGKTEFQTMAMSNMGSGIYQATLTPDQISTKGVNYFIRVSDGFNLSFHPNENWDTNPNNISVRILGTNNQGLLKGNPQPGGSDQFAFRMISAPLILVDPRPQSVLEDNLGPYDPRQWRLFQYNPLTGDYFEFPNIDLFSPAKAFWLIVREPNKQIDSGVGTTVPTNQPFQITLKQGWNDIGNPFTFPVKWSDVAVVQGNPDNIMGPYTFNGQWLLPDQVTTLFPWEGYSIFSQIQGTVIAISPIEADNQPGQALRKQYQEVDWFLKIEAVCQAALDGTNFIGVSTKAVTEWDKLDYLEPPYIGEYVSLRFPRNDWPIYAGVFTTDYRPPFDEGQVWRFEVKTNISKAPITLNFQNLESLPSDFQAVLLDLSTFQQIDIQQNPGYEFVPDQSSLTREFDLIIGTRSYIQNSDFINEIKPKEFSLSQNYPNPFNAGTNLLYQVPDFTHVSIKVLNILGQEVRQLISQQQEPGVYKAHWDGKSQDGRDAGSGIYIIRLEAGRFQQSRKVLLIR